ncbi:hypothetical protein ABL78_1309 [Leptomonas seymouri]|uniref:Calcium uniporter protein C-terminal domain-containing protein n=1 Tax=Leptomonas seymouri TaxID=5684 RepID=A0A0N1PEX8_LEPSE|nr:hypothetical protein ABL78_1309 [Leptomonas seymouri]|eukprot:KPI89541.1 hypothetical protein ABL78_1309 [Leptomonas seymouri]
MPFIWHALQPRAAPLLRPRCSSSNFRASLCLCASSDPLTPPISCAAARRCSTSAAAFRHRNSRSGGTHDAALGAVDAAALRAARDGFLKARLSEAQAELNKLDQLKTHCDEAAQQHADRRMRQLFLLLIFQSVVLFDWTYIHFDWNLVEPITYLIGYSATWIAIIWYGALQRELSYDALRRVFLEKQCRALYAQHEFDVERYAKVKMEVAKLEKVLRSLEPL